MGTKGPPLVTMGRMKIQNIEQLEKMTNATLRAAMSNERSKRWNKVIQIYKILTRMLNKKNFPPEGGAPPCYSMLMYEIYYHLGTALQHVGEHKKAVSEFTKAIDSVFIPKNGCMAGCNSNSCLMTPLYARRAFAYAKAGDWKHALKDAEKAVMLDHKNPDVYCIRALVRSTRNELSLALEDAKLALKYNPNHLCALIIKGCLQAPLEHDEWLDPGKTVENIEHKKACSINPDCHNFLHVQDFNHHDILTFYERFLYSLSIPHTVSEIVLVSRRGNTFSEASRISSAKSTDSRFSGLSVHDVQRAQCQSRVQSLGSPFRCGTPSGVSREQEKAARRRRDYAEAIREHMTRPKTAEDAIAHQERQRRKREIAQYRASRLAQKMSPPPSDKQGARSTAGLVKHTTTETSPTQLATGCCTNRRMTVFQETNVKDAPRMYYRPWLGDKLPVADINRKQWNNPPFKV